MTGQEHLHPWPALGRLGICRRGSAAGSYILLWQEERPDWWSYYLSAPEVGSGQIDGYVNGDASMIDLLRDWDVEWLPSEEDERMEKEIFDVRRTFRG